MSAEPTQPAGNSNPVCATCPMAKTSEWRARWAKIRSEVHRHDLTLLELQVMDFLVDHTYGWGRRELVVQMLNLLPPLVGMDGTALGRTIKKLHKLRMIHLSEKKRGDIHLSVNENIGNWGTIRNDLDEKVQENLNRLRIYNGLPAAHIEQDAALNFEDGPLAKILAAVVDVSSSDKSSDKSTSDFPNFLL